MRRHWTATLALFLVFVLGAAACGSGDDSSSDDDDRSDTTEASAISEDDWVDEVSDLCQDWIDDAEDVDGTDADDLADAAEFTHGFADDVEELGEPEDIGDEAGDFVDTVNALADFAEESSQAIEDDEDLDTDTVEAGNDIAADLVDQGDDLGLDCDLSFFDSDASTDFSDDLTDDFSDQSDFTDDFSDDPADGGFDTDEASDPTIFIPEFGDDADLDQLALDCEGGDFEACDTLFFQSPVSDSTGSYEGYGATCGGRLAEEDPGTCANRDVLGTPSG